MNIVVLTGAGISQESGIPTFRGRDGLWNGFRIEEVATPAAFSRDPERVHQFYNLRRQALLQSDIQPNPAHLGLARLQREWNRGKLMIVTQNIDDLHERAGCEGVLHMHGELLKVRCLDTGEIYPWTTDLSTSTPHPENPDRTGRLRPHVVWFGEVPFGLEEIQGALNECDLFLAVGTSGMVYPAAGFVRCVPDRCRKVEINLEATPVADAFDESLRGPASTLVPQFVAALLEDAGPGNSN